MVVKCWPVKGSEVGEPNIYFINHSEDIYSIINYIIQHLTNPMPGAVGCQAV